MNMKKSVFITGLFLYISLLLTSCAFTKTTVEHPLTLEIDLSKFARNISFTQDENTNVYSFTIQKVQFKNIPLSGDTLNVYCSGKSNLNISYLDCEILSESESLSKIKLINTSDKKSFIASSTTLLLKDFPSTVSVKLSFKDENLPKKPWLQLETAKIPSKKSENNNESKDGNQITANNRREDTSAINEDVKIQIQDDSNKSNINSSAADEVKIESKKIKKSKKNELPEIIQYKIDNTPATTSSWFICKVKSKNKAGNLYSGPFETNEQAIVVWIYKNLKEKKRYCIAKNYTYVTDTPSGFFGSKYDEIYNEIQNNPPEQIFKKYFVPVEEKVVPKEIIETKTEEVVIEETPKVKAPVFELPLITTENDLFSKYQKEYLQDYAPKKQFKLPEETIRERIIENPNEADAFGCTLLMKAARNGNNWEIKSLLSSGADVNLVDDDGWTALMYACRYQENISIVETLINAGAQIKNRNKYNLSALILAASYNGNPEIVRKLLSYYSVSEKEVIQAFVLLLSDNQASDFSKLAKIDSFLEKSIPLNTFYNGKTPLMYAAQFSESTKILQRLMDAGAITAVRSTEGKTAFDYAQENIKLKHDDTYWSLNKK